MLPAMEALLIFIGVILIGIWIELDRILTAVKKINGDIPARGDDEDEAIWAAEDAEKRRRK